MTTDPTPPTDNAILVPLGVPGVTQRIAEIDLAVRTAIEAHDPAAPLDAMLMLHDYCGLWKQTVAAWAKLAEAAMIDSLIAHGTPDEPASVNVGDIRYYCGTTKRVKCNNNGETAEAILEACAGDFAKLAECMASSAWKYGAVRQVVGDRFDSLFTTDEVPDLKEGKPKVGLHVVNTNFLPARRPWSDGDTTAAILGELPIRKLRQVEENQSF